MPSSKLKAKQKLKKHAQPSHFFIFEAIGTSWSITIEQDLNETQLEKIKLAIDNRIEEFDHNYSRFRNDSLVTSIANQIGKHLLPSDAEPLLDLYQQLYYLTEGLMTPLIGQMLSDAGYDSEYSLKPSELRSIPSWIEALEYSYPDLLVKKKVLLDFGAAGKGYLVDIIARLIEDSGIKKFCINAGGDILNHNVSPALTKVGLEHPILLDQVIGVADLQNKSLCGSAGNRRAWENFNHIIDPKLKQSPSHILAVWVVADSTLIADGIATAIFFTDIARLNLYYEFEYALIREDLSLEHSEGFPAEFFTEERAIDL